MVRLAQWIMRGRFNALVAAAMLGLVPVIGWTSMAVVALVALRRNLADALWPLVGALLVALTIHWPGGDVSQLGAILAALAGALVLANSRSLANGLVAVALVSGLYIVILMQWAPQKFDPLQGAFQLFLDQLKQTEQLQDETRALLEQINLRQMVIEGMAGMTALAAAAALLLARWLQARLYNPGGFQAEFHRLRLAPAATVALLLGLLITRWQSEAVVIVPVLILPLLVAGLALFHGVVAMRGRSSTPLVFFYLTLVLLAGPALMVLIAAAITDSFVDFRKRIGAARP